MQWKIPSKYSFTLPLRSLKYSEKINSLKFLISMSTSRYSNLAKWHQSKLPYDCVRKHDSKLYFSIYSTVCSSTHRYESLVGQNWSIFDRMIDRRRDRGVASNENTAWCVWGLHYWHTCYSRRHGHMARLVYVVARMYIPGLNVTPVIPNSVYCLYLSSVGRLHFHSYIRLWNYLSTRINTPLYLLSRCWKLVITMMNTIHCNVCVICVCIIYIM